MAGKACVGLVALACAVAVRAGAAEAPAAGGEAAEAFNLANGLMSQKEYHLALELVRRAPERPSRLQAGRRCALSPRLLPPRGQA